MERDKKQQLYLSWSQLVVKFLLSAWDLTFDLPLVGRSEVKSFADYTYFGVKSK
ncbi:hypothetical protein B6N60_04645 [Richelia sinica FACHB-800]|uniref:Uncharacterized protein n=1 Tax=Richelia sinica FACHB-800 TaxID=1357546 RepID=A0A975TBT8_9NOST|nr:hypothetical protein [Richelia sinica]MBD2665124.1 hypothetical protein [Richelia sinica FACHB-800]QXE25923.1 hypothetical protein B6N60_04645 [Richelia sinica FACHB-800]